MGHHLTVHRTSAERLKSLRVGTNGAGSFLVEQWIAGYAISKGADPQQARKVRQHWLVEVQKPLSERSGIDIYDLSSRQGLVRALQDDTRGCSWVRCHDLDRTVMRRIRCPKLFALVALWHMARTFWDWHPTVQISASLLDAVEMSTLALEEVGAPWAPVCREAADLLREAGAGAAISLG